jgi:long-chain acyl-CoA synthetase
MSETVTKERVHYLDRLRSILALDPVGWAIEFRDETASWGDIANVADDLAAGLAAARIGSALTVGLVLTNRPAPAMAAVGMLLSGHSMLLLNPMQPEAKLANEIKDLTLAAVVARKEDWTPALVSAARAAGSVGFSIDMAARPVVTLHPELSTPGSGPFRTADPANQIEIQTSGTTGAPKRISITRATLESALVDGIRSESGKEIRLQRSPTFLFAPLPHTAGIFALFLTIYEGRPVVLFDRFDIIEFRKAMIRHRPRFVSLLPPVLRTVLQSDMTRDEMSSLLAVRSGSAPLSPEAQKEFEDRFGVPVLVNYGATEFMGVVASWTYEEHKKWGRQKLGSVGRARRGTRFRIVDQETFEPLPTGERGLLEVDAASLGLPLGWTRTTDIASLDADGFLYIHGRADDAINRGGFKVMANQVADVIRKCPGVADALVVGIPDERLGEVPVCAVERHSGATVTEEALREFARSQLTAYQVPARFRVVEKLPRTISMKISMPEVRKLFDEP